MAHKLKLRHDYYYHSAKCTAAMCTVVTLFYEQTKSCMLSVYTETASGENNNYLNLKDFTRTTLSKAKQWED